jgi:membrane-associated protease RseP (regulator of RpoE activity)
VRIIGMSNLEEVAPEDEARSYRAQSFGKRMPVVLAGPAVNIALGFLLLVGVFAGFGRPTTDSWVVGSVNADSGAAAAGIEVNDRFVAFGDEPVTDFDEFRELVRGATGTTVDVTVERDGSELVLPITIGWALTEEGAASLPGLEAGDQVTAVDGATVSTYDDLVEAMGATGSLDVAFTRNTERFMATVEGPVSMASEGYRGLVGVGPETVLVTERAGVVEATGLAATTFGSTVSQSVGGIFRLFSPAGIGRLAEQVATASDEGPDVAGNVHQVEEPSSGQTDTSGSAASGSGSSVDTDRPSSIIGIVDLLRQFGEENGWGAVLYLFAVVNIFLGLINLLPLLPFDGGHIAVACYEEVRTRISHKEYRVDMAKLMPVTYVVLLLFVGLFLATGYMDIVDPIRIN